MNVEAPRVIISHGIIDAALGYVVNPGFDHDARSVNRNAGTKHSVLSAADNAFRDLIRQWIA